MVFCFSLSLLTEEVDLRNVQAVFEKCPFFLLFITELVSFEGSSVRLLAANFMKIELLPGSVVTFWQVLQATPVGLCKWCWSGLYCFFCCCRRLFCCCCCCCFSFGNLKKR